MSTEKHVYINGTWESGDGKERVLTNPHNEQVIQTIQEASKEQTEKAVHAAREAFTRTDWSTNKKKRTEFLRKAADGIEAAADEIAEIESRNTGKPIRESVIDVEDTVTCLRYYAGLIEQETPKDISMDDGTSSWILREPIGVCALIVPWNFPLLLGMWKIAPALAAGNTVVFKPSEVTPLSILKVVEIFDRIDLPEGVFNVVLGDGDPVGDSLVTHPLTDKVSFTGGSETGRKINETCARSLKRVSLELGGKSPLLVFDDAEINNAVEWILFGGYFNQGEVCVASSRILVQESIYPEVLQRLKERIEEINVGDPMDDSTEMGPIINRSHFEKVTGYLKKGVEEGATLYGGEILQDKGYYMRPAVFADVTQEMSIVQEEIFGPVITIQPFKDEEEAVYLANDTIYGLAAGVLSADIERAERVGSKLQAGTVWVNNYHIPYIEASWGGYKQSGIGRELGPQGLYAFTETKHLNINRTLASPGWYA
ncbi:aldehyde dehydrogenase family protein [Halobacillus litoralis]|uniref:aldehyde dehydrogenase family protein n=1 Tax=Halobacillus litoralis TaxID=45668 RepID=UPI001CFC6350|nr:aldehyde dehydrogenase family protein [Halobacillus litoralis]